MFTFDNDTVSDLHKDAYGFRPCQNWWADWGSMNDVGKQQEWDSLVEALKYSNLQDELNEKVAIEKFEKTLTKTIASGAPNRETAIRWLFEGGDYNGDMDYFAWNFGLPYNYFSKV